MMVRARLVGLALVGALVGWGFQPTAAGAQIADDGVAPRVHTAPGTLGAGDDAGVAEALRRPSTLQFLAPTLEVLSTQRDDFDAVAIPQSGGGGRGMAFMVAGGAALVGGLIIGGNTGTVIAAAGVALGVYGILIYF